MQRGLWVLVLGLSACSDRTTLVIPELPSEIAWVGLLFLEPGNEHGTGLYPVENGRFDVATTDSSEGEAVQLVGFSAEALARHRAPDAAQLSSKVLLPEQAGHALMRSNFSATGFLEEATTLERDLDSAWVSAEWRPPCADLALVDEKIAHVSCLGGPCAARARQEDCRFELSAPGCELEFRGAVQRNGTVVFDDQVVMQDCQILEQRTATELSCDGPQITRETCEISLHSYEWEAPAVTHSGAQVLAGLIRPDALLTWEHLLGLVRHQDQLITVSAAGQTFGGRVCTSSASFSFIDLDRMEVTRTEPAPECPQALAYDEVREALLLVHGLSPAMVSRLDMNGDIEATAELPAGAQPPAWYVANAFVEPDSRALVIALAAPPPEPGDEATLEGRVVVFDVDTMEPRALPLLVPRQTRTMFAHSRGKVALPHGDASLAILDTYGVTLSVAIATGAFCGPSGMFLDGFRDAQRGRFVLTSRGGINHGISLLDESGARCEVAFPLESSRSPMGMARWPGDPALAVVGLDGSRRLPVIEESVITFFDLERQRFLLGEVVVGRGPIKNVQPDGADGLVMVLPGEARIVRVRPAL